MKFEKDHGANMNKFNAETCFLSFFLKNRFGCAKINLIKPTWTA